MDTRSYLHYTNQMTIEDEPIATSLPKPSKTKAEHLHETEQSFLQLDAALKRQNDMTGGMIVTKNMIIGNLSSLMTVVSGPDRMLCAEYLRDPIKIVVVCVYRRRAGAGHRLDTRGEQH